MKIIFFAALREQLACESLTLALDQVSVMDIRQQLIAQHPEWALPLSGEDVLVAINQTMAKFTDLAYANDEVAFFPPVTGG